MEGSAEQGIRGALITRIIAWGYQVELVMHAVVPVFLLRKIVCATELGVSVPEKSAEKKKDFVSLVVASVRET